MQPLLVLAVVLAVVAVLVLRGVADNFAAGVVIQASKPIDVGHEIQVEGPDGRPITGVVTDLNSRTVVLETYDGRTVHVPNAKMVQDPIVNHSARGLRRSEVQVRTARGGSAVDRAARAARPGRGIRAGHLGERAGPRARRLDLARAARQRASSSGMRRPTAWVSRPPLSRPSRRRSVAAGVESTVTSDPGLPPLVPSETL